MSRAIFLRRVLLPVLVFIPLSYFSYNLVFNILFPYIGKLKLLSYDSCPAEYDGTSMFRRQYVGGFFPKIEQRLCRLVSFFYPVVQEETAYRHFVVGSLTNFAAVVCLTFVEASRMQRPSIGSLWILLPVVTGVIYQLFTGAATLPVFWVFLVTGQRQRSKQRPPVVIKRDAQAIAFGMTLGYGLPTYLMLFHSDVPSVLSWQIFPVIMGFVCGAYLFFTDRKSNSSGYIIIQSMYGVMFISLILINFVILKSNNYDFKKVYKLCLPPWTFDLDATVLQSFTDLAGVILQWDLMLIFSGTFIATLWFATNTIEVLGIAAWYAGGNLLLGAGPTITGVLMWREWKLNQGYAKIKEE